MKKFLMATGIFALLANAAFAGFSVGEQTGSKTTPLSDLTGTGSQLRTGLPCEFFVAGTPSHDGLGAAGNTVVLLDAAACVGLPSGTPLDWNGVGWDVTLFADINVGPFGGSWLQELGVNFNNSTNNDAQSVNLNPGAGSGFSGTASYASPIIKLGDVGLLPIHLANGVIRMEFFESFDDAAGVDDGRWLAGVLTLQFTPEPATMSLLALGGLVALRRRK